MENIKGMNKALWHVQASPSVCKLHQASCKLQPASCTFYLLPASFMHLPQHSCGWWNGGDDSCVLWQVEPFSNTGFGKSLIFQCVPFLREDKKHPCALIIYPLNALEINQANHLKGLILRTDVLSRSGKLGMLKL